MQTTICLSFAGSSGSPSIIYYKLYTTRKILIELCNTKGASQVVSMAWNALDKENRETPGLKRLQTCQHESSDFSLCRCCQCAGILSEALLKTGTGRSV